MRFPIQVVAKSRTPEEHRQYYRWVRFVTGRDEYGFTEPRYLGIRSRWFHSFMDLVPKWLLRRLPVRWQVAYIFGDLE